MSDYANISSSIQRRNDLLLSMAEDCYKYGKVQQACDIIKQTFPSRETIHSVTIMPYDPSNVAARVNAYEILEAIYPVPKIIDFIERMSADCRKYGKLDQAVEIAMIIQPVAL